MTAPMDAERWQQLESLCMLALATRPADRADVVNAECPHDAALAGEALALAAEADANPNFLETPLVDASRLVGATLPPVPATTATDDHAFPPSERTVFTPPTLGTYRVIERVGEGGMAEVYRAERDVDGVSQAVAIKVLRRGTDTDEMLRRFYLERRILASLSHPNIASLIDAGATADGRPFVVMDFVDGTSILRWCDEQRLTVRERLQLFRAVCDAVQHAHQHFVVHRDIKPSNILVREDGRPALLDFGIGKVLSEGELGSRVETTDQSRLLTPDYASPEQITGGAITTATDVYALGLLLFELLTGEHPLPTRDRTRAALDEAVLRTEPRTLADTINAQSAAARRTTTGTLRRQLRGDLDVIVRAALRKEPARRYPTVTAFAEDVERYLDGRPVRARPDSLGYRTRRFVGRHTTAVTAAAVALVALAGTTTVVYRQNRAVERSAQRATLQRDRATEVRSFLLETFGASGADRTVGDTVSVRRLLDLQREQVGVQYADQPELRADMLEALAEAYDRLGLPGEAEPLAQTAVTIRRAADPAAVTALPDALPAALTLHGWLLHVLGRSDEAEPLLLEAIARRREDPDAAPGLARSLNDLGVLYNAAARYDDAEGVLAEALALRETLPSANQRQVGITANNLAAAYYYTGRYDEAARVQDRAVAALTATFGEDHQRTIVAQSNLATFRLQAGDRDGAADAYRTLLERQRRLQGAAHPVTAAAMTTLAAVQFNRAVAEQDAVALHEADTLVRAATRALLVAFGEQHPQLGRALHQQAMILQQQDSLDAAVAMESRALAALTPTLGEFHPTTLTSRHAMIRLLRAQGDAAGAQRALQRLVGELAAAPDSTPRVQTERARADAAYCAQLVADQEPEVLPEAVRVCERAVVALEALPATVARLRARTVGLRDSARNLLAATGSDPSPS
jgi:serine/threonine protein kinase/tetratricopeptide (TPR) repeat protein